MKKPLTPILFFLLLPLPAQCKTLYTITFDEPGVYQPGKVPVPGPGIHRIAAIDAGSPRVTSGMSLLEGNSLRFRGRASADEIELRFGRRSGKYTIRFELVTNNLRATNYAFNIWLNIPKSFNMTFHGGLNSIYIFSPFEGRNSLALLRDNRKYEVSMELDFDAASWSIAVNGKERFRSSLQADELKSIQFSLAPWNGSSRDNRRTQVFLDDIEVIRTP